MALKFDGNGIIGRDTHDNLRLNSDGTVTFEQLADGSLLRGNNLSDVADKAAARANLGLGSASTVNAGTGAGQVVVLDGNAKLPAVDGSQLRNLPDQSGGSPNYLEMTVCDNNTWYQAPYDIFVAGQMGGPYTNDFYCYAGPNPSSYNQCGRYGDDINNNTKWATISFSVKAGDYFYVGSENNYQPRYFRVR